MGAPVPHMNPVEDASAEALLSSLRTIAAAERRKHASVFNYWLSIRRDRQFPPIRDLDPLEISDAGPYSLLLEMIGGGEDAEIRHIGHAIKNGIDVTKVGDAPNPSLLSCVASRLPVVAACREAFAFEDKFETPEGKVRCWVTLLPFSATGTWIDYVYGFVSLDPAAGEVTAEAEVAEETATQATTSIEEAPSQPIWEAVAELAEPEAAEEVSQLEPETAPKPDAAMEPQAIAETDSDFEPEPGTAPVASAGKAGFSKKFFESLASGFYGRPAEVELDMDTARLEAGEPDEQAVVEGPPKEEPIVIEEAPELEPNAIVEMPEPGPEPAAIEEASEPVADEAPELAAEPEPVAIDEPVEMELITQVESTPEGTLQSKLTDVRAKADEARQAKLRANAALYEGLSAAYDFALDAEDAPEDYLRLVEAQGLKIQLRSPMKPVVKLAFDGMCDDATIKQLEAILAWAFDEELPRGTLAERIESEGGIAPILTGQKRAA
ncbi:hypothetical protein [Sphingomonas sp. URHD0057]|uniref:hypothetical protein n=1 Tax=Sphingomonas sp. URHD0057 TaxID=1380389 RepID=UPI0012DC8ACA|nr:hypothetical protein [Sphingomonas sp. URHD0057]